MRSSILLFALLAVAGCASTTATPVPTTLASAAATPAANAGAPTQICEKERRVGSDIPVTVCRPAESESQTRQAVDDLKSTIRNSYRAPGK